VLSKKKVVIGMAKRINLLGDIIRLPKKTLLLPIAKLGVGPDMFQLQAPGTNAPLKVDSSLAKNRD
jgi:hypothetical protein